jgi:hypothetical protein
MEIAPFACQLSDGRTPRKSENHQRRHIENSSTRICAFSRRFILLPLHNKDLYSREPPDALSDLSASAIKTHRLPTAGASPGGARPSGFVTRRWSYFSDALNASTRKRILEAARFKAYTATCSGTSTGVAPCPYAPDSFRTEGRPDFRVANN